MLPTIVTTAKAVEMIMVRTLTRVVTEALGAAGIFGWKQGDMFGGDDE